MADKFIQPDGDFKTKCGRQRLHAVGAASHQRVLMLARQRFQHIRHGGTVTDDRFQGLRQL